MPLLYLVYTRKHTRNKHKAHVEVVSWMCSIYTVIKPALSVIRVCFIYASSWANIEQTSSKYDACIKHSLYEANIELAQAGLLEPRPLVQM